MECKQSNLTILTLFLVLYDTGWQRSANCWHETTADVHAYAPQYEETSGAEIKT